MKVFALYEPKYIGLIGPWMRSWEAHGFSPRLVLPGDRRRASRESAVLAKGGGALTSLRVFNRQLHRKSVQCAKGKCLHITRKVKGLVFFPAGTTREQVAQNGFI